MICELLLIDGKNLMFRAGHSFRGLTARLPSGDEIATGATFGFLKTLVSLQEHWGGMPVVCWEGSSDHGVRRQIYSGYKVKEYPNIETEYWYEGVMKQLQRTQSILTALGVGQVHSTGWEADDVMGTLAWHIGQGGSLVGIVTTDADLIQVVRDNVSLIQPKQKAGELLITVESYKQANGIEPRQYYDVKCLTGCNGDMVPGVPSIGPKRGLELIREYGDVDTVVSKACNGGLDQRFKRLEDKIKEHLATIEMAKQLVRIHCDTKLEWFERRPSVEAAQAMVLQWNMKSYRTPNAFDQLLRLGTRS